MASPTMSAETMSLTSNSSEGDNESPINLKCGLCRETYTVPKVLNCFHTFCQLCLDKMSEGMDRVICPSCRKETPLTSAGCQGLVSDLAVSNVLEANVTNVAGLVCTACKTGNNKAHARCYDCANLLCGNCTMAHQFMHCFEGHRVITLADLQASREDPKRERLIKCIKHKEEPIFFFCRSCNEPICKECTGFDHVGHDYMLLNEMLMFQNEYLSRMVDQSRTKANDLRGMQKSLEHSSNLLLLQYRKSETDINDTYHFYKTALDERRSDALKDLSSVYNAKKSDLTDTHRTIHDSINTLHHAVEFLEKISKHTSNTESILYKKMLDDKLQSIFCYIPDNSSFSGQDMEFSSNFPAIQAGIVNTFGYLKRGEKPHTSVQPIARPSQLNNSAPSSNGYLSTQFSSQSHTVPNGNAFYNGINGFDDNLLMSCQSQFSSTSSLSVPSVAEPVMNVNQGNLYERWSNGGGNADVFQNTDVFSTSNDPVADITSKLITANIYPPKSQIKRSKMVYHGKFGEFGVAEGQFTEPSGVAVNAQNDIIVADTNNHRIQIFDKEGRFKFQFGECGKRDGQLLYPNRVAVVKTSGDIVVTERSPTHQVQIYNQYGQFVRKFGANILQHPRGVTVDNKGRIIIVECKVMRVIIFDQMGNVLHKFGCSKHLEFPNGVVVNDREEILISDNRAHCVKVFSYQGVFFRQIGGEGVTNYPIGVGINNNGEVLVADNHNNFNLTVFSQDGHILYALESKVKHAQCFDVALMDEGSIVLASKDYRLYIYRYMQTPGIAM